MITKIEVDGFKSLSGFTLNLRKGLNILVGPNGSGKTNIILFFEFLSTVVHNQIGNAISSIGGAGSIFKKVGNQEYSDTINAKIYGCYKSSARKYILYEYSFEIKISFEKDNVFYSKQEIKFRNASKFWDNPDSPLYEKASWDLHIKYLREEDKKPEVLIESFDRKKVPTRFFPDNLAKKSFDMSLKEFVLNQTPSYYSLLRCVLPINHIFHPILLDLRGGETFNVVPSKVRELEDSAKPPGISRDGSGLATTLYAMKKSRARSGDNLLRYVYFIDEYTKDYSPKTLEKIVSFLKMANTSVVKLDVDNDAFNNKLVVKIYIESGDYNAVLPLSSMSDGTIKWLALITAILTSKTIFSIEEPENFLHPWMQAEIAVIMRDHLQDKKSEAFVLMTTHSESLLNYAEAEEVIIVDLKNGKTKAKRLENLSDIKDVISNSGFGLGHFYFSNALC